MSGFATSYIRQRHTSTSQKQGQIRMINMMNKVLRTVFTPQEMNSKTEKIT